MELHQLSHLPRVPLSPEKMYAVHEQAVITGKKTFVPKTLSVIGIYHKPADPRGMPNCEEYIPDYSLEYLVFAEDVQPDGAEMPYSRIRYSHLSDFITYESGDVSVSVVLPLTEILSRFGRKVLSHMTPP